jgi:hypothetical protein
LSPFQQFCVALKNIPQRGRLLGDMTIIDRERDEAREGVRFIQDDEDAKIFYSLEDLMQCGSFACGGEVQVRND